MEEEVSKKRKKKEDDEVVVVTPQVSETKAEKDLRVARERHEEKEKMFIVMKDLLKSFLRTPEFKEILADHIPKDITELPQECLYMDGNDMSVEKHGMLFDDDWRWNVEIRDPWVQVFVRMKVKGRHDKLKYRKDGDKFRPVWGK